MVDWHPESSIRSPGFFSGVETHVPTRFMVGTMLLAQVHARGPKLCSWHAPEVECIGKSKAHKPYEFGVKVSITTTNKRCKAGMFVLHAKALPGNPYDGHSAP